MSPLDRLACAWVARALSRGVAAGGPSPGARLVGRHLARCPVCAEAARQFAVVERGLAAIGAAPRPAPPAALRSRTADAFNRATRAEPSPGRAAGRGRLERMAWASGAAAVSALVLALGWARFEAMRTPPRTVRILLPAGVALAGEPGITIRRASGKEERR